MKVSACWITKNEEKKLPRSIMSVKDAVDELVVVDTGSTDDTVRLAEELGAKVSHFEWIGDFSAARNYAMSLCEGEIVIFLDADEWFKSALTPGVRGIIEGLFIKYPNTTMLVSPIINLTEQGISMGEDEVRRVLRKRPDMRYYGRIHESYGGDGSKHHRFIKTEFLTVLHDGYAGAVAQNKAERNIELLEEDVVAGDSGKALLAHLYLVREYGISGDLDKATEHLYAILDDFGMLKKSAGSGTLGLVLSLFWRTVISLVPRISAIEIEQKVVRFLEKTYPDNPVSVTARLYWRFTVDGDEEHLLAEIDGILEAAHKKTQVYGDGHLFAEKRLLAKAADAAELRGETERAVRYAEAWLKLGIDVFAEQVLAVLLRQWRGVPAIEVLTRIRELHSDMDKAQMRFLMLASRVEGHREVAFRLLKELYDKGLAEDAERYIYLFLANRKEEAEEIDFSTAVKPTLGDMSTFFEQDVTGRKLTPMELLTAGMYEELLAQYSADPAMGFSFALIRVHALMMLTRYQEAMGELLPYLAAVPVDNSFMRYLAVLGEKLTGELQAIAENIYQLNRRYYQRLTDWGGLVRREYAVDTYDKKTLRRLATLTEEQLEEDLALDRKELATEELLDLCEQSAGIYEKKKMHGMALECWLFAYAHGREDAKSGMGRMIAALSK